jgi:hypothetical protein
LATELKRTWRLAKASGEVAALIEDPMHMRVWAKTAGVCSVYETWATACKPFLDELKSYPQRYVPPPDRAKGYWARRLTSSETDRLIEAGPVGESQRLRDGWAASCDHERRLADLKEAGTSPDERLLADIKEAGTSPDDPLLADSPRVAAPSCDAVGVTLKFSDEQSYLTAVGMIAELEKLGAKQPAVVDTSIDARVQRRALPVFRQDAVLYENEESRACAQAITKGFAHLSGLTPMPKASAAKQASTTGKRVEIQMAPRGW